jgi:hypothetical protein
MQISGPEILARTLSKPRVVDNRGNYWNYHSRSDHHSKVCCWAVVFDLLRVSSTLQKHVAEGHVGFGINHEMRDFQNDRRKNLDLVICRPASGSKAGRDLVDLATHYRIDLSVSEQNELTSLPRLQEVPVGSVLVALEAKACMTAHQKALPRLYDELNSTHLTVHGAHDSAIAAGIVVVNIAQRFLSPSRNIENPTVNPNWNVHPQPKSVEIVIEKVKQLPRRSKTGIPGYDALGIVVIDCPNDGSDVRLYREPPAPQPQENYHYTTLIERIRLLYDTRFAQI